MANNIRRTVRLKKPNPLFEAWLTEWKLQAEFIDSDKRFIFEKALESLRKYPLVINSGKECLILEHFDTSLCIQLDRRLAEHRKNGVASVEASLAAAPKTNPNAPVTNNESVKQRKRKKETSPVADVLKQPVSKTSSPRAKKKPYLPKNGSAGFALLVTLLKNEESSDISKDWMSKSELQKAAQPLCCSSFTEAQRSGFYTAWSNMSHLVTKKFVKKQGNPARFSLTPAGRQLGVKLVELYPDEVKDFQVQFADPSSLLTAASDILAPGKKNQPKSSPVKRGRKKNIGSKVGNASTQESEEPDDAGVDFFLPNSFDVVLLVDTAETIGAQRKSEDETIRELTKLLVKFDVRKLNVGDFIWVARHRETGKELTLPFIVERKRMDDLASSIKDGRFHEQKYRLKNCGLKCLIYLVERMNNQDGFGLPLATLNFSITRTQVNDNFWVQIKHNHKESMLFLAQTTELLRTVFETKTLFCCKKEDLPESLDFEDDVMSLCTFHNFNHNIGKTRNFTVKEIFQKQLLQLHGVSCEMVWTIVQTYPTPLCLRNAFILNGESLLENLLYGPLKRRIRSDLSKALHKFYTAFNFNA